LSVYSFHTCPGSFSFWLQTESKLWFFFHAAGKLDITSTLYKGTIFSAKNNVGWKITTETSGPHESCYRCGFADFC
jgi:hypothetical protein